MLSRQDVIIIFPFSEIVKLLFLFPEILSYCTKIAPSFWTGRVEGIKHMLSPNAKVVLRNAQNKTEKSVSYFELENMYGWSRADAQSACGQLVEKGYAKVTVNHGTHGEAIINGIVLTEEGRFFKRYVILSILKWWFNWFSEHLIELTALVLSILALLLEMRKQLP